MKRLIRVWALLWVVVGLAVPAIVNAQQVSFDDSDPMQRKIVFHNDFSPTDLDKNNKPRRIYPVIQASQDDNCRKERPDLFPTAGELVRLVVNAHDSSNPTDKDAGIGPGQSVEVTIPKQFPCNRGMFYRAGRIYIFATRLFGDNSLEKAFLDRANPANNYPDAVKGLGARTTTKDNALKNMVLCPNDLCWIGRAKNDYGHDAPAQLLEYTIISQNPYNGAEFVDPNDPRGRSLIDFDVSYVDDAYLPVIMALLDTGATQYMGSATERKAFNAKLKAFLGQANWTTFAAYDSKNWTPQYSAFAKSATAWSSLVEQTNKVPSANILIENVKSGPHLFPGASGAYAPIWPGDPNKKDYKPTDDIFRQRLCVDPVYNKQCGLDLPTTQLCCPDINLAMLGCCDRKSWLIDELEFKGPDANPTSSHHTQQALKAKWLPWTKDVPNPCTQATQDAAPVEAGQKNAFCAAYHNTVKFLWAEFGVNNPECNKGGMTQAQKDDCTLAAIIGYSKKSGYDPEKCKNCSKEACDPTCVHEVQRNESVQAVMRNVPWIPQGPVGECAQCPNLDATKCPASCVIPPLPDPAQHLYHRHKFLHFWASPTNVYNLNPFTFLIHHPDGINARGAYSFSIDDFYGNFGGIASRLIVRVGLFGTEAQLAAKVPNPEPYDPYKQFKIAWGGGWHHLDVCGRRIDVPIPALGGNTAFSFWRDGIKMTECVVTLYETANETLRFVKYKINPVTYSPTDTYTGLPRQVEGLAGVWPTWLNQPGTGGPPATCNNDGVTKPPCPSPGPSQQSHYQYCFNNSNHPDKDQLCRGNLSPINQGTEMYVQISDAGCVATAPNTNPAPLPCGKPMVSLNIPAFPGVNLKKTKTHDFNGDGKGDILWRQNGSGQPSIWLGNGLGLPPATTPPNPGATYNVAAVGDFNNDGFEDIAWRDSSTGKILVWLLSKGTGTVSDPLVKIIGQRLFDNPDGNGLVWTILGAGDFNFDGRADILWRTQHGSLAVWLMNGIQTPGSASITGATMPAPWVVAGLTDFDNSGSASILWRNTTTGDARMFLMNGTTIFRNQLIGNADPVAWQIVGVGDFNQDGKKDILWRNVNPGVDANKGLLSVWFMDGTVHLATSNKLGKPSPSEWTVLAVADYDGNSVDDILWRQTSNNKIHVWLMIQEPAQAGTGLPPGTKLGSSGIIGTAAPDWQAK
jgi:hypothetical protein